MSTLTCWWLSIHFDKYLMLCGYSHYIYIWIVGIFCGSLYIWLVEPLVLELYVNVILIECKRIVLGTLRN